MGFVVDRIGGGKVLIAGLFVQAAAIAAIAAVPSYWILLVVIAVAGLAHSVYHPADYAILSRAVPEGRLGRAYTFHSFSGNIGTAAAPMVMVSLAAFWDWRGACLVVGLAGIAVAAGADPVRRAAARRRRERKADAAPVATRPTPSEPAHGLAGGTGSSAVGADPPLLLFLRHPQHRVRRESACSPPPRLSRCTLSLSLPRTARSRDSSSARPWEYSPGA